MKSLECKSKRYLIKAHSKNKKPVCLSILRNGTEVLITALL